MPTEQFERLRPDRKNSIIKALTRQFATRDYAELSVKELADEADISRGSFYLYFSDKEDAFLTSVRNYTDRLEQDLLNIYSSSQDIQTVVMQVFDYLTHLSSFEHSFFEKISNNLTLGVPDIIAETFDQFSSKLNTLLESRVADMGIELTPQIREEILIRREILFSIMLCSLINIGINRTTLAEEREALQKKIDLVVTLSVLRLNEHTNKENK